MVGRLRPPQRAGSIVASVRRKAIRMGLPFNIENVIGCHRDTTVLRAWNSVSQKGERWFFCGTPFLSTHPPIHTIHWALYIARPRKEVLRVTILHE